MSQGGETTVKLPKELAWLADAPLFIDDCLVARFHDAIVRPLFQQGKIERNAVQTTSLNFGGKLGLEAGIEASTLVQVLTLGMFKPSAKATAEGEVARGKESSGGETVELIPIETPQRQLEQLALYYCINVSARFKIVGDTRSEDWRGPEFVSASPRSFVLLDLPGHAEAIAAGKPPTKLIPTAAEFENGKIELIYERLRGKHADEKSGLTLEALPTYPDRANAKAEELKTERAKYWAWFDKAFSATQCMVAVEEAARENGRIRWIDFRLPLTTSGDTLHLHVCPGGRYDTGALAYNLIKRGFKHGIRLVGTLKSEPDMNVLAIYEK